MLRKLTKLAQLLLNKMRTVDCLLHVLATCYSQTKLEGDKMDKQTETPSSQFLRTDGGKTESNAIEVPSISLPKGGGAIKGIDEKFSVNAVNGTASFSIPLPFSPARGASPALGLSYNSGAGNGIFGLGWALSLPSIKRWWCSLTAIYSLKSFFIET